MPKYYSDDKPAIDFRVEGNIIRAEFQAKVGPFLRHDKNTLVPMRGVNLDLTLESVSFLRTLKDPTYLDRYNRRQP